MEPGEWTLGLMNDDTPCDPDDSIPCDDVAAEPEYILNTGKFILEPTDITELR